MAKLKLNDDMINEICTYIGQGLTNKATIDAVGISEVSFYAWVNQGEKDLEENKNTIFVKFIKSLRKAETKYKLGRLAVIRTAATNGNWQAAAWELERRFRDEYGRNAVDAKVELTGKEGGAIETKSTVQVYLPSNGREVK